MSVDSQTALQTVEGNRPWIPASEETDLDSFKDRVRSRTRTAERFSTSNPREGEKALHELTRALLTSSSKVYSPSTLLHRIELPAVALTTGLASDTEPVQELNRYIYLTEGVLHQPAEKSQTTTYLAELDNVRSQLAHLFASAREEIFEDGMESEFSRQLVCLIKQAGSSTMAALTSFVVEEQVNSEVFGEALRWLGRLDDPATYLERRWLLQKSLFSLSPTVRDGAILGLASMHDASTARALRKALESESYPDLREDMEQLLEDLGPPVR